MKVPYAWSLFVIPQIITILQKNNVVGGEKRRYPSISLSMLDEESMHCFFIIFLIPSGWILKLLMHICLALWALMNCVDMAYD